MPYTAQHKQQTRDRIVLCARQLFNRKGFAEVSIDEIMTEAGLTRGGFYNHFQTKDDLFVAAIDIFSQCNPADRWEGVELDWSLKGSALGRQIINAYLSREHLEDLEGHCPMIALPSDTARAGPMVKNAYRKLLEGMVAVFESGLESKNSTQPRDQAMAMAALCVGAMVLARTFDDPVFANEIREAALAAVLEMGGWA